MRENLERILKFMATKRIRMHQITSREILEGNLKAVMRLILALAAHYKPQSVRHHDAAAAAATGTAGAAAAAGAAAEYNQVGGPQQHQQQLSKKEGDFFSPLDVQSHMLLFRFGLSSSFFLLPQFAPPFFSLCFTSSR